MTSIKGFQGQKRDGTKCAKRRTEELMGREERGSDLHEDEDGWEDELDEIKLSCG